MKSDLHPVYRKAHGRVRLREPVRDPLHRRSPSTSKCAPSATRTSRASSAWWTPPVAWIGSAASTQTDDGAARQGVARGEPDSARRSPGRRRSRRELADPERRAGPRPAPVARPRARPARADRASWPSGWPDWRTNSHRPGRWRQEADPELVALAQGRPRPAAARDRRARGRAARAARAAGPARRPRRDRRDPRRHRRRRGRRSSRPNCSGCTPASPSGTASAWSRSR